ncbi:MAG TPA: MFS transporter [Polyangiaceae bacterium]
MIAQLVFGKAARDALFLSTFPVSYLPATMICAAALSAVAVLFVSRALARHTPARVVPWLFVANAALFVGECLLALVSVRTATIVFYVHMGAFGATVISSFWSLVNERFDPHSAKRVVSRIATGGTLGGIVGSVIAWRVSTFLNVPALLLFLAGLNALCFVGARSLRGSSKNNADSRSATEPLVPVAALSLLRHRPYLRHLAGLVALLGVTSAFLDYVLAAQAATFASGRSLMAFFAVLYMSIALLGFVVQVLLSDVSLQKLGVSGTVATLPIAVGAAGVVAALLPGVATVVALRAIEAVLQNSLFRSAYELLYTPIAKERKRSLKLIIDVGLERTGIAVGSAITLLVIWLLPGSAQRVLLGATVAIAAASVLVARRLQVGYVSALEDSMRTRSLYLGETDPVASANTQSPVQTDAPEAGSANAAGAAHANRLPQARGAAATAPSARDPLLDATADLRSADLASIRRVLSARSLDPVLVPHVIPLLANDELAREVVSTLRSVARRVSGQLVDTLLDRSQSVVVRRRIPRVLRVCDGLVAVAGLTSGLADPLFEIRQQCGLAILRITERCPELMPPETQILTAVVQEVAADKQTWDSQRLQDALDDEDDEHADDIMRERSQSLEHVFTLLSLVYEPEPLKLAFRALGSEDDRLRGTALEYLENVLSAEIHERLWTYFGDLREYRRSERSRSELLDELQRLANEPYPA